MVLTSVGAELRVEDVMRAYVSARDYTPDSVDVGGKQYAALAPKEARDLEIFIAEQTIIAKRTRNPAIADILARNAPRLWDVVRMVNSTTKVGYGGAGARGSKLLANVLETRDFGRAGGFPGTAPPDSWLQVPAVVGSARLWPPTSGTIDMLVSSLPVLGHVIYGFVDPVAVPKVSVVQLFMDSDPWAEETMDWEWREGFGDNETPIYELKNPWVIRPGASYRVSVRNYITGEDRLTPIGFSVKRALEIIASLAT